MYGVAMPSSEPTGTYTRAYSEPTQEPTSEPTEEPVAEPTYEPEYGVPEPVSEPTSEPTQEPTSEPTQDQLLSLQPNLRMNRLLNQKMLCIIRDPKCGTMIWMVMESLMIVMTVIQKPIREIFELESNFDCMTDADDDSYGDQNSLGVSGTDCDDQDASIHPNAPETAGDGIDSNCNGNDDN